LKRSIVLCVTLFVGLASCGKETFLAPPDCSGRFLVAFAHQPAADQGDVYLFDYDELGFHGLNGLNSSSQADLDPTLTRDVEFIAFERVLSPTNTDILFYDRCQAGLVEQPGLNSAGLDLDPAFSGDGLKLAFVRDTLGRREVRLYDGTIDRLVPLPGIAGASQYADSDPVTNQTASLIAFSSDRRGNHDILVYDASGDSLIDLPALSSSAEDVDPSMTPDGRYLVFASDRTNPGDYDLYLYDLQTRQFVALAPAVNTAMTERHPSINFDTDRIVFESNRTGTQGSMDIYLYTRSNQQIVSTGSSTTADVQPWIVWQ